MEFNYLPKQCKTNIINYVAEQQLKPYTSIPNQHFDLVFFLIISLIKS